MSDNTLSGLTVLNPRPAGRGLEFDSMVRAAGGEVTRFPVIEIVDPPNFGELDSAIDALESADLLILVSVNAVDALVRGLERLQTRLPAELKVAVIGVKTAIHCEQTGVRVDYLPVQSMDSEALLCELDQTPWQDKQVVIFRGQSGREVLKAGLEHRGARVRHVECYRRQLTTQPVQPLIDNWKRGSIDIALITSVSILEALVERLGKDKLDLFSGTHALTISQRIAENCRRFEFKSIRLAAGPEARDLLLSTLQIQAVKISGKNPNHSPRDDI